MMPDAGRPVALDLAINGRFLTQPITGVQRVAREITREIDRLMTEGVLVGRVRLICQKGAKLGDLDLSHIVPHEVAAGPGHLWEQLVLPFAVGNSVLLCLGNTAPIASLVQGKPVAVMVHDLSYRIYPGAYRRYYRLGHASILPLLLRYAKPLITVSETEKATLMKLGAGRGDIVVAQNGGWRDIRAEAPVPAGRSDGGYGLYVGSFSQRKNVHGLLAAITELVRADGMRFVLVGSTGSFLSPTSLDLPEDVKAHVTFRGHVENVEELAAIYRGANCLIFPSFYEASPLPPLEAMHFGCPVVASDIPSVRERCGDATQYCDPADVASIVAAVRRVLGDKQLANSLVEAGYRRAKQFSWRAQALTVVRAIETARRRSL
jgi:glycosyltransferase involved in cell wall biosynthesis